MLCHNLTPDLARTFTREVSARGASTKPCWIQTPAVGNALAIQHAILALFQCPAGERPDGLIIADDNFVEHATLGLTQTGVCHHDEHDRDDCRRFCAKQHRGLQQHEPSRTGRRRQLHRGQARSRCHLALATGDSRNDLWDSIEDTSTRRHRRPCRVPASRAPVSCLLWQSNLELRNSGKGFPYPFLVS